MRENPEKMRTRITPNTDSFYTMQGNLHFESAKYRVLDEKNNVTASISKQLEFYAWNIGNQWQIKINKL